MLIRAVIAVSLSLMMFTGPSALAQTSITAVDVNRAKAEIELLKQDIQIKEAELQVLELQLARQAATPAPPAKTIMRPVAAANAPVTSTIQALPTTQAPVPIVQRANIDPAPYEASITGRVSMFRMTPSSMWRVLDEKRLVYWVVSNEAYLLNLAQICPGLLDTEKLKLENFSTKVLAGRDHVIFGDQRCLIASIAQLGGRSLPKPPKN